jgi:hypothetical protein
MVAAFGDDGAVVADPLRGLLALATAFAMLILGEEHF